MLILTPDQANQVRGLTVAGHALAPALLTDGNFALPEAALDDPYHAVHAQFLRDNAMVVPDDAIGTPPVAPPDGEGAPTPLIYYEVYYETDPNLTAPHTYSSDWPEGEIIVVE